MGWAEAIAAIFKVIGMILDLQAKGKLDRQKVTEIMKAMTPLEPPKEF